MGTGGGATTDAWVARMQEEAQARLEAAARLEAGLADARATGTSVDRAATVTVASSGVVVDVGFTSVAERLSADELRSAVLEALGRAQTSMSETVARLTDGLPGAEDLRDLVAGRVPASARDALREELADRRAAAEEAR